MQLAPMGGYCGTYSIHEFMEPRHLTSMKQNIQVPIKWVLVIVAVTVLAVSTITAVTPLGEQMNALAVTIAGDVVCSQCVSINGDGTNDIKDASVTSSKIAGGAVTNAKIASSAVTTTKLASNSV